MRTIGNLVEYGGLLSDFFEIVDYLSVREDLRLLALAKSDRMNRT